MIATGKTYEADIAIIGGGIAALTAALSASSRGASCVMLDKGHVRRSGSGATGNDHFACYIPEVHGPSMQAVFDAFMDAELYLGQDEDIVADFFRHSQEIVRNWESMGINMRPTGKYVFQGHALPGETRVYLKYDGCDQKACLLRHVDRKMVTILNHSPVIEILREGDRVSGVLAVDTSRESPSFTLVRAKTVILATGATHRLYHSGPTPAYMFNTAHCPNDAGGPALALRAGAAPVNMEFTYVHAGPKFFERCGKATWIGVFRYPDGRPLGPFATHSDREYGDVTGDVWNTAFDDVMRDASGPAYMDCSDASAEDLAYMRWAMKSEGLTGMMEYMDEAGIDPARHAVEFARYEPFLMGRGVEIDRHGRTCVPGLYCAGDSVGNFGAGIGPAAYMGDVCGREAAEESRKAVFCGEPALNPAARERMELFSSFMERKNGATWQEANFCLQQIMDDYAPAGPSGRRSANLLNAGLQYVRQLRERTLAELGATCSHTLMRSGEVLDLIDCGEALLRAALERKESRNNHCRTDFPFTNPLLRSRVLRLRLKSGSGKRGENEFVLDWRDHHALPVRRVWDESIEQEG